MAALASVDDVADLLALDSSGVDADQAAAVLAQASARFRAEAGCDFDETETTLILRVDGQRVTLPKRPVLEVDTVKAINADGTAGAALAGWTFDGIHTLRVDDQSYVINAAAYAGETVEVTWTHGYDEVPEDVRWTVAQMAARAISSPAPAGVAAENIGAYGYRTAAATVSGAAGMTDDERVVAHRYRPVTATMTSVIT